MKRVLCSALPAAGKPRRLPDSEAHHLLRVLRLEAGDRVEALDGSGKSVLAVLTMKGGETWLEFDGGEKSVTASHAPVVLEVAVLKGDAMEWVIEKAAELGVFELIPVLCHRTVVQIDRKGPAAFQQRWQKIADQALKQCGRLDRMNVAPPTALSELLAHAQGGRLFFDEEARETATDVIGEVRKLTSGPVRLLVGPEGGFTDGERALVAASNGVRKASLGPLVLRAETAAIAAVSIVTAALRNSQSSR